MTPLQNPEIVRLALPKGRMMENVLKLLADANVGVLFGGREYRPQVSLDGFEAKLLKPQNAIEMIEAGSRDIGFAGADWAAELNAEVVELLDTGLDPVRIVAAAPVGLCFEGRPRRAGLVVASEYERLARRWIECRELNASFVRSYGATEVFPPEDADLIVDNTATGSTLAANGLEIVDTLMTSSTRLFANPRSLEEPGKRERIEGLVMLLRSVLDARRRVMIEVNVPAQAIEAVVALLPCMREPTVSRLHGEAGFAVKAAVPRESLASLIPAIKSEGGADIVVSPIAQLVS